VLIAAKLFGEIGGIHRFQTDAQLARLSGCAPIPVSSGRTDRHRLDRGGNRQLNHAFHMLALTRINHDPQTARYIAKQHAKGKNQPRSDPLSQTPPRPPRLPPTPGPKQRSQHRLLDIGASGDCRFSGSARVWAIAQVRRRRRRVAADCCFQRFCLQANGSQLPIRAVLLLASSRCASGLARASCFPDDWASALARQQSASRLSYGR
jgi:hypothetical protein